MINLTSCASVNSLLDSLATGIVFFKLALEHCCTKRDYVLAYLRKFISLSACLFACTSICISATFITINFPVEYCVCTLCTPTHMLTMKNFIQKITDKFDFRLSDPNLCAYSCNTLRIYKEVIYFPSFLTSLDSHPIPRVILIRIQSNSVSISRVFEKQGKTKATYTEYILVELN